MRSSASTEVLPIWRTDAQVAVLAAVFATNAGVTAAEIARRAHLERSVVGNEVRRLERAHLIRGHHVGRSKLLTVVPDHPATKALRSLVNLTVGPLLELRELYALDSVVEVAVFGSWARRHLGEPGAPPADVDVLVVTNGHDEDHDIHVECDRVSGEVGLPVNPWIVTAAERDDAAEGTVLREVLAGEMVMVERP